MFFRVLVVIELVIMAVLGALVVIELVLSSSLLWKYWGL